MHLRIAYLYPEIMNIYGDRGNIIALTQRCLWRGIRVSVDNVTLNQSFNWEAYDLFFGGGGQDRQQSLVARDLQEKGPLLKQAAQAGKVFLLICGTYQLFGHYFQTHTGEKIPGIGILDLVTIASNYRKIGNVLVKLSVRRLANSDLKADTLVGFENHSGNTFINQSGQTKPLGTVVKGFGNNGQDKTEGAVYEQVYGTYLHGSLLPKNPHFTDFLIRKALENRYHKKIVLESLDDTLEWQAHTQVLKMIK
jgi:hypothetical protein